MCVIFFPLLKAYDMIMNKLDIQIVTQVARISVVLKCSFSITLLFRSWSWCPQDVCCLHCKTKVTSANCNRHCYRCSLNIPLSLTVPIPNSDYIFLYSIYTPSFRTINQKFLKLSRFQCSLPKKDLTYIRIVGNI